MAQVLRKAEVEGCFPDFLGFRVLSQSQIVLPVQQRNSSYIALLVPFV